ncbi:hypothetical protein P3T24_007608 [Paraburkholderia sp. GAS33]|uniref:Uncharacterized protein n=1 Tax=Paraburkholderia phenazinium TaxID=60549 RepID=A0A1N6K0A2_9BURK|nr:hypothetical protein SAMN05444168_5563 [Paraburkholderia phenazinium]
MTVLSDLSIIVAAYIIDSLKHRPIYLALALNTKRTPGAILAPIISTDRPNHAMTSQYLNYIVNSRRKRH